MLQLNYASHRVTLPFYTSGGFVDWSTQPTRPPSLAVKSRAFNIFVRIFIRCILLLTFVNFKVANRKIIPKKEPVIIVGADHTSLADAVFMVASIRCTYACIGMAELKNTNEWPWIIGKLFDWLGHIPIDRGNSQSGDNVFAIGLSVLDHGQALVLWPQGRQVPRGSDQPWYPGFARFAKTTGTKIYVFKVEGPDNFWPTNPSDGGPQKIKWRAKVRASFSQPIDPNDYATVEELIAATRRVHAELRLPS